MFGDLARGRNEGNLAGRSFSEPDITVRAEGYESRITQAGGAEGRDLALQCYAGHLSAIGETEPKVPVRARSNVKSTAAARNRDRPGASLSVRRSGGETNNHRRTDKQRGQVKAQSKQACFTAM